MARQIEDLIPALRPAIKAWGLPSHEWVSDNAESLDRACNLILVAISFAPQAGIPAIAYAHALLASIIEAKHRGSGADSHDLDVLHFFVCSIAMGVALTGLDMPALADWVIYSLHDDPDSDPSVDRMIDRFRSVADTITAVLDGVSDSPARTNLRMHLVEWAAVAFYYFRRMWAMGDLASAASDFSFANAMAVWNDVRDGQALLAMLRIAEWSAVADAPGTSRYAQEIEAVLHSRRADAISHEIVLHFLGMLGTYTRNGRDYYVELAYTTFFESYGTERQLDVLVSKAANSPSDYAALRDDILTRSRAWGANSHVLRSPYKYVESLSVPFGTIEPLIRLLVHQGDADEVVALLQAWMGQLDAPIPGTLIVSPGTDPGIVYAAAGTSLRISIEPNTKSSHLELINALNATLGVYYTLQGADVFPPKTPGREDAASASTFHKATQHSLGLAAELKNDILALVERSQRMIVIGSLPVPYQAVMLSVLGKSLPLCVSLEPPASERSVRRVAVWKGEVALGDYEVDALREVFGRAGISIDISTDDGRGVDAFREWYESTTADVAWIIGHGERPEHYPAENSLPILRGEKSVRLSDVTLMTAPTAHQRRLLVINVCNGGTPTGLGGYSRLGLAGLLASSEQAVVSHLWPIHVLASVAFGVFLAHALASGKTHFESFAEANVALNRPSAEIAAELEAHYPTLSITERIRNNVTLDFQNLLFSGSSVFYE